MTESLLLRKDVAIPLFIIAAVLLLGALAPWLTPYEPDAMNLAARLETPTVSHWLGTDLLGRDILTRLLYGIRSTVCLSLLTMLLTCLAGALYGSIAVAAGARVERLMMRLCDALMSFPGEVMILAIVGMLGPGLDHVVLACVLAKWSWYARMMRSMLVGVRSRGYLRFAELAGASRTHLLLRHYIPSVASEFSVLMTLDSAAVMLMMSALGFLGLGVQPPAPEWGMMLSEARDVFFSAPYQMLPPGLAIVFVAAAINFLGDGLRDALDVRRSRKGGPR